LRITFEGREWQYDEDAVSVQQAVAMHFAYGFTLADWSDAVPKLDPRAIQCVYWLMLQQNGIKKPLKECEFALVPFVIAYGEAQRATADATAPAQATADPTTQPSPTASPASPVPAFQTTMTPLPPGPG
jgi:hypothetical protein